MLYDNYFRMHFLYYCSLSLRNTSRSTTMTTSFCMIVFMIHAAASEPTRNTITTVMDRLLAASSVRADTLQA